MGVNVLPAACVPIHLDDVASLRVVVSSMLMPMHRADVAEVDLVVFGNFANNIGFNGDCMHRVSKK